MASVAVLGAGGLRRRGRRRAAAPSSRARARARHRAQRRGRAAGRGPPAHARPARARGAHHGPRRRTPRSSPTRTAPRRPWSPSCSSAGSASSTCPPTSACTTLATYEQWYGEHPAPDLLGRGGLRAARAAPRPDPRSAARRQPRLLPDRGDPRPRAAGGPPGGRGHRRQVRRLGRGARALARQALRHRRRDRDARTRWARTATRPRSRRSSACPSPSPRTSCRSPTASSSRATCGRTARSTRRRCTARHTRTSPGWRSWRARQG